MTHTRALASIILAGACIVGCQPKTETTIEPPATQPVTPPTTAENVRERVRELITLERSMIRMHEGEIGAKCEFSAVTNDAVQLMGVWTHPRFRRKGLARETLREVCGHLFRKGKSVTLFVNDFNLPAIALYESLGFTRIGMNRALIW